MQISQSKTRKQFPLSPKKIIKKTIVGSIFAIIVISIIGIFGIPMLIVILSNAFAQGENAQAFGGLIGILLFIDCITVILMAWYQRAYFAVYYYELTDDFIIIRKGPITPREITIPYERVQDVYVDQDIVDRMFGLYDVHLSSATVSSGMQAHIDGVEKPAADGLRALLLQTVSKKIGRK
ncbi:MAG: PH domain-containing protein [Candidatus Peregrinibacteria bacterium]